MAPRTREPWWHAQIGWVVSLAITATGGFVVVKAQLASLEAKASQRSDLVERRDREVDDLRTRVAALEARCR